MKAVGAKRGVDLGTHASLWEYVSKLDKENPNWNLRRDFAYAGNLHQNFYEDWLPKEYIKDGVIIIKGFVNKLKTLLRSRMKLSKNKSVKNKVVCFRDDFYFMHFWLFCL